ncbi:transcriptional regulator [Mediterraneibacter glycyrrhizinilyticus]|uniref:helix-turn-helix domain-containing protein n=1 Tax=Mediterraneibacter glycyrrhizinilyticus TaxID=342942 RepID=UPI001960BE09|nr:transcriptional regulator [Mediterraneibacter glycyrrhizinilyticus]MBM6751029.1 transcriptional regulator [Mediterraneibacter glycyrrhizinilyticus]
MDKKEELIKLRTSTGMNKAQFARYFGIPYRTYQEWELGGRRVPEYLLRLMAYKVKVEKLGGKEEDQDGTERIGDL